jgi:predicted dienelactone hydrolase
VIFAQNIKSGLISLLLGISAVLLPTKISAAEKITFSFPPFGQFNLKVDDLQAFVATGEISPELAYYLNRLPSQQVARLPELLSTPFEFNPLTISKFSNSSLGEAVIKNFAKGIRADVNRNGFYALRGAIIAAAFDPEGLTLMNLLQQFPLETIYLDLGVLQQYLKQGETLEKNRQAIKQTWFAEDKHRDRSPNELPDISTSGQYTWSKRTLTFQNPRRTEPGIFELYQPKIERSVPLIVISHGVASSRKTFAYLGQHLASYGFAVAVIEHQDISLEKFAQFLAGAEKFPKPDNLINQPLDVKYVLDRLEQESKLNLQQVGIIGQSFGGYTALALAGAKLTSDRHNSSCEAENYRDILLDLSSLAQCSLNELKQPIPELRDPRIKAAIAINPMGKVFGQAGISSIETPTMIVSGTNDLIMPPVVEQIRPFTWLNQNLDKYLVLVKPGTHFSFLQEGLGVLPVPDSVVGPSPTSAHPSLKALSTAFFQVYLAQQPKYQTYLRNNQINKDVNSNAFELSIIRSLSEAQLEEIVD